MKFVKYLPQLGWTPVVFTPEDPSFEIKDESLLADVPPEAEVIHFPIWEPYRFFIFLAGLLGKKRDVTPSGLIKGKDRSVLGTVSKWIRGNLFIPDPRRFWVKPSAEFLTDFIIENKIRTIITTGPPHSVHLIGLKLKRTISALNWIADFRDPWSQWGFLESLHTGKMARYLHRRLEKKVLAKADTLLTITPFYVRQFSQLAGRSVNLLTNGFDEDDFRKFKARRSDKFIIRHVGVVNERCDPRPFLMAIKEMTTDPEFKHSVEIEFVGDVNQGFKDFVTNDDQLSGLILFTPPVPHNELIQRYQSTAVHLLILYGYKDAEGYLPGKLFEYLATGLPILGVGPSTGDAAEVLNELGQGRMVDAGDGEGIKTLIQHYYGEWKAGTSVRTERAIDPYSRRMLTSRLIQWLV